MLAEIPGSRPPSISFSLVPCLLLLSLYFRFIYFIMTNVDNIITMREEELLSRKGSVTKQDLIEAVCVLKRRSSQEIALDAISDVIEKSLRERLDPIVENLKEVTK